MTGPFDHAVSSPFIEHPAIELSAIEGAHMTQLL
jgi:hypothetical protein